MSCFWQSLCRKKYCVDLHPCQVKAKATSSTAFIYMKNISVSTELNIFWILNEERYHLWYDNWTRAGALYHKVNVISDHFIFDFVKDGKWEVKHLREWLPTDVVETILYIEIPNNANSDIMVWHTTESGEFSLSLAFQKVHNCRPSSFVAGRFWQPHVPFKVSMFIMRLLIGRLPLDVILTRFNFHLPSKCFCCASSKVESIKHFFLFRRTSILCSESF